jgi:hypothetical protein
MEVDWSIALHDVTNFESFECSLDMVDDFLQGLLLEIFYLPSVPQTDFQTFQKFNLLNWPRFRRGHARYC